MNFPLLNKLIIYFQFVLGKERYNSMEMKRLEIDNSAEAAVKSGRWKNPGSSFYYKILNSFRITDESKDEEDVDKYDFDFRKVLKEAYLIAPVEKIKNSPYGITSYSQSGCKYPHHVIKDGKLVVSVPGIQAAYSRAKQQGIFKGDVKSHIEKHYKELGLDMSTMTESVDPIQEEIDLNFDFIQKHIESTLGVKFVHDDVMMESVDDVVDKEQYIKETFDWMDEILYESDDDYNRKIDEENEPDQRYLGLLNYENTVQEIRDELSIKQMMPLDWSIAGIKEMLESYAIYEKSHGSLKYEYRMGVDIDTGKLVCIQFKLEPDRIQQIGNRITVLDALYHQNSDYRQKIKNINALIMNASANGNVALVNKYNKERKRIEDEAYQKFNNDNLPEFKKSIKKLGNIDYTAGEGIVDKIFYYQGGSTNKVRMIPTLSPELEEFLRTISRTYGDELAQYKKQTPKEYTNDPNAFTISYTKLFASPKYQFVFKTYAKSKGLRGETYEVGKPGGESKYRSTKIMWDNLWMYQKFTASPALRGRLTNNTIVYDPMRYTGMNKPKVESIETDAEGFNFDEIDFEEKYSAIDATESEWNEFWSLFKQNRLHKTKSQMLNYYNQYLEYIESTYGPYSDKVLNSHHYKEKIDEMVSNNEHDFKMHMFDCNDIKYLEIRKKELIPISDNEFINEALNIKSRILAILSLNKHNAEPIERYNNEIAYLIECKHIPSIKLDRDAINWEYMNFLEHSYDDRTVDVNYWRWKCNGCVDHTIHNLPIWMHGIHIPEFLKSYNLCERSNITSDLKYSYQIGIDINTGKLTCIRFNLMPMKYDGYRTIYKDGKLIKLTDSVNNIISRIDHIDSVGTNDIVDSIMYYDGTICDKDGTTVHILPIESEEVREFLGKMYNYDSNLMKKFIIMSNDRDDGFVLSLSDTFTDPKVQNLFVAFVKQFDYQPLTHEVGKSCGPNRYQCTYIPWDPILLYQQFGDAPKFKGPVSNINIKSIGNPSFIDNKKYEYKESHDPSEIDVRIADIRNNIKKYEEIVQNMNTHTRECNNEFITVNPNDGVELRENTWNHFMKLIDDSEDRFELAKSNNHYLELVESIDEDTDFSDKDIISLIEEYASFVERNSLLKHEYRMGVDINNGRLVAIEFDLDPNRITKVGNRVAFNNANSYSADPINHFLTFLRNKRDSAKTEKEWDSWNRQIKDEENKIYQQKSDKALDELKKTIKRTGHIDYVSKGGKVTHIFYYDGTGTGKHTKGPITMIPVLSPKLDGFINYLNSMNPAYLAHQKNPEQEYNILNDRFIRHRRINPSNYNQKDKYIYSLTSLFTDPEIQKLFVKYVKDNHINGETYQVGTAYPNDERFKTTKILWDAIWMYRKFTYNPVFRGTIPTYELENNTKNAARYNGLNKPREAKKKKPIKESTTDLLDSIYEALYPLDPRSYEAMSSLLYDDYLEALELHGIDVSAILNSKLPEDINLISEITSNIDWLLPNDSDQFSLNLSSYLEADDQSEENDQENQVDDDDIPPNIDLGDEEIESDEPPTIDTDEPEPTEEDTPSEDEVQEDTSEAPDIIEPTSLPKATDAQEENKNGVRRKKLYIAFIEWAKSYNQKNTFGSIFDKDAFDVTYPFVPHEMRYFYRLANPILCVLSGSLTFFQVSELRKLNANNPDIKDALIFAATENDYRVFSTRDKKVYVGVDKENGSGIAFTKCLADSFDLYIQNMIDQGDILNGPIASESDSNNSDENNDSDKE